METVSNSLSQYKELDEKLRLEIKQLADSTRINWAMKGFTDIFSIIEDCAFLIRKPLKTKEISAFTTYMTETFIVFLNSSFSLGHERFSAAHELYHIEYNSEILKREKLHIEASSKDILDEDCSANIFAAEFLMPEDAVKKIFYKLVNVQPKLIEPRHVVRLNSYFNVSYAAMVKRLIQLGLCDKSKYAYLRDYGSIQKAQELQEITRKEGFSSDLLMPSNVTAISREYIEYSKANFESNKISYGKIAELLSFIGETPEDYGYKKLKEEDYL